MTFIILTYLAGVLTILSPCILPVLPFVFSRAQESFLKNGLPLLFGMSITFSLLAGLTVVGGEWIGQANEIGRLIAIILMTLFGLLLVFPKISEIVFAPATRLGDRLGQIAQKSNNQDSNKKNSISSSLVIGASIGLLWAPCAGPILGLVLTGVATQNDFTKSFILLFSYSLGAATSLGLALVAGNKFLKTLKKFLGVDQLVKKAIGLMVLLGVITIIFNLDKTILTQLSKVSTDSIENRLLGFAGPTKNEEKKNNSMMMLGSGGEAPVIEGLLPELDGADEWLNSVPLNIEKLRGKVVLIDFWTYSCINCLRTLPYLKSWYKKYKDSGFVIVGIHTPEFAFEKNLNNVKKAINDLEIMYPVAIDNHFKLWNSFNNHYWPAHYFIDRLGRIRHHHFGEGEYDQSEKMIRKLLSENGKVVQTRDAFIEASGAQAPGSLHTVKSFETYIGYSRAENFVSINESKKDQAGNYQGPKMIMLNEWYLSGNWKIESERAVAETSRAKIVYRFHARDLHLVLGGDNIDFRIKIDGQAPGEDHGVDVDQSGFGRIQGQRLYQLIRQKKSERDHTFEIEFLTPGAEAYAFTFG